MFAVGHLALGYLTGKTVSRLLDVQANVPLLFVVAILPDGDLLIPGLQHRGPLHSVILLSFLFLPALLVFRKRAIPPFVALLQHSLIGDYLTGTTQLLWPLTSHWYGAGIPLASLTNLILDWTLFLVSITVLLKTKDMHQLVQRHQSNIVLSVPVLTVLLPTLLQFPLYVPLELVIPHLVYLALFGYAILTDLRAAI